MARFQYYRDENSWIRWRLLGGNNRVLGIGESPHVDQAAAVVEIDLVRQRVAEAKFDIERANTGLWWWRMRLAEEVLVKSPHGFHRRIDAQRGARRFLATVPDATDPVVVVLQSRQPRRYARRIESTGPLEPGAPPAWGNEPGDQRPLLAEA